MMIHVTIDGKALELEDRTTILTAAKKAGIKIPTLCHNDKLKPYGGCRVCLVEVKMGKDAPRSVLVPACTYYVEDGIIVDTQSDRVKKARVFIIELFLSRSPESEDIQRIARELGVDFEEKQSLDVVGRYLLERAPRIEHTKCVLCGLCIRVCAEVTERHSLSFEGRGMTRRVVTPFKKFSTTCIGCGSCAYVCPTNAITIEEAT
jgi:NADH dehydrogenase/NADH:ubiquinone oxidoreductase subunit G